MKMSSVGGGLLGLSMLLLVPTAWSAVTIEISESGGDLVIDGSGTLDLSGCTFFASSPTQGGAVSPTDFVVVGPPSTAIDVYDCPNFGGPASFGIGGASTADSGTGDSFGLRFGSARVAGPAGYVSGDPLAGSSTYVGESFASLGLTPDTSYIWKWSISPTNDKVVLNVGNPPPAGTLWTGPDLVVTQSDDALTQQEDVLLVGVASLARGRSGPFCNLQGGDTCGSSDTNPSGLEFAFSGFNGNPVFAYGSAASHTSLTFRNFKTALEGAISGNLPPFASGPVSGVVRIVSQNIYFDIEITHWQNSGAAAGTFSGFGYRRSTTTSVPALSSGATVVLAGVLSLLAWRGLVAGRAGRRRST